MHYWLMPVTTDCEVDPEASVKKEDISSMETYLIKCESSRMHEDVDVPMDILCELEVSRLLHLCLKAHMQKITISTLNQLSSTTSTYIA